MEFYISATERTMYGTTQRQHHCHLYGNLHKSECFSTLCLKVATIVQSAQIYTSYCKSFD